MDEKFEFDGMYRPECMDCPHEKDEPFPLGRCAKWDGPFLMMGNVGPDCPFAGSKPIPYA